MIDVGNNEILNFAHEIASDDYCISGLITGPGCSKG